MSEETICGTCAGVGEVWSLRGDRQNSCADELVPCPRCGGRGFFTRVHHSYVAVTAPRRTRGQEHPAVTLARQCIEKALGAKKT
jgi:hypothetical protein